MSKERLLDSFMLGSASYDSSPFEEEKNESQSEPEVKSRVSSRKRRNKGGEEKSYMSVKVEQDVYAMLLSCQSLYQVRKGGRMTLSDAIRELLRESGAMDDIERARSVEGMV